MHEIGRESSDLYFFPFLDDSTAWRKVVRISFRLEFSIKSSGGATFRAALDARFRFLLVAWKQSMKW